MKRVVFILLLVYASSILNMSELCAQKVQAGWVHVTTEKEKIEKEKKEKEKKEKKEVEQKEIKDYTHSIGIAVGSSYGLAYKYFFKDNWALKVDATCNALKGSLLDADGGYSFFSDFDFNPNVMYHKQIKTFKTYKLDFFAGGGTTVGYAYAYKDLYQAYTCQCGNHSTTYGGSGDTFVWGLNSILGLEINLTIPMTIEFDFRPGYGLFAGYIKDDCNSYSCSNIIYHKYIQHSFFDWSVNMTINYKF